MSLVSRLGQSFGTEFKRPSTQVMFVAMGILLVGSALQLSRGWTNANRPFWIDVLWAFSPVACFGPAFFPSTERPARFWRRLITIFAVHAIFLSILFSFSKGIFVLPEPWSTLIVLSVVASEVAFLAWLSRRDRKSTELRPEQGENF